MINSESVRGTEGSSAGADRRAAIRAYAEAGELHAACEQARLMLQEQASALNFRWLRQFVQVLPADVGPLRPLRLALLSSFSIEFLHDALVAFGFASGLRIEIYQSGFGQIRQEVFDSGSGLYAFGPNAAIIAVEGEDWLPQVYTDFLDADAAALAQASGHFVDELHGIAQAFRERSTAPLLVHDLAAPRLVRSGIADARLAQGQGELIAALNRRLCGALAQVVDTHVLAYASLVAQHGSRHWYDERMRLYARAPIAAGMFGPLVREYMKYLRAFSGLTRKCLIVDLDNTMWGGVIGEDGIDGIQLGPNYPGNAFLAFQRAVLDLYRRGVILAVASKNNLAEAEAALDTHRSMLVRREHFAALEIHWEPKSESIRRIAARLSIGLEHIVFVDDSPLECEQVRRALPMVSVIQLPRRPEYYAEALLSEGLFDTLGLSDEDRRRGELYRQRAQAETLRPAGGNLEDYFRELDMELRLAPVDPASLARAAQLTQKTNQFNLTTIRYSEAQLAQRMLDPSWLLTTVGVRDRFGDNGIVGLTMAQAHADHLEIDTFLLSCRVIGRGVETAMLAALCDAAKSRGLHRLSGRLIITPKNTPARDLYERHGFTRIWVDQAGSAWELDLRQQPVPTPDWFRLATA